MSNNPYKSNTPGSGQKQNNTTPGPATQFTTAGTGRPIIPSQRGRRPPNQPRTNRGGRGPPHDSSNQRPTNTDRLTTIPGFDDRSNRIPPSPAPPRDERQGDTSSIQITGNNNRIEYNNINSTTNSPPQDRGYNQNDQNEPSTNKGQTNLPPPPAGLTRPDTERPTDDGGITDSQLLEVHMDKATATDADLSTPHNSNGTADHHTEERREERKNTDRTEKSTDDDTLRTIYKTLLPSGEILETAYQVPEDTYRYNPVMTITNPPHWETRLNEFTDFDLATAPLIPSEKLSTSLRQLQNRMEELSHQFDKQKKSIERAYANTNHTHKCVNIKATFHTPQNASKFPQLKKIFDNVNKDLKSVSDTYSKLATKIIVEGQKAILFQHRLERILVFTDTLIHNIANFHAYHYRQLHKHKHKELNGYVPKTREELATLAVHRLLLIFDHELYAYFDTNPKALLDVFHEHRPESKSIQMDGLNDLDKQAVDHTLQTMCRYVKLITSIPYNRKMDEDRAKIAAAETLAAIERQQAREATKATKDAIMQHGAAYPNSPKTLTDAVLAITRKQTLLEQKQAAKKKLHEAKRKALQAKRQAQEASTHVDDNTNKANLEAKTPHNRRKRNNPNNADTTTNTANTEVQTNNKRYKSSNGNNSNPKVTGGTSPPSTSQRGKGHNKRSNSTTRRKRGQRRHK